MSGTEVLTRNGNRHRESGEVEKSLETDFRMVTFSLGGKEYGIDIMKVKEIVKYTEYTYVPNAAPYVRGVYNLRGEIISVIDLRIMFNLPIPEGQKEVEEGLILRLDEGDLGVVVDTIHRVVAISSEAVQPPHPIFGDINIKHVSGVAESAGQLYILLDVEKVFSSEEEPREGGVYQDEEGEAPEERDLPVEDQGPEMAFVQETLETFRGFHVSALNSHWFDTRFQEWKAQRRGENLQITSPEEADTFLAPFYSPDSARFWSASYAEAFSEHLDLPMDTILNVWNPGCGKGFETYSLTALLVNRFSDRGIKVRAHDNDLLAVSTAPNLVFPSSEAPEHLGPHLVEGKNGWSFTSSIKDRIMFEYHNVLNESVLPALDIILARDLLSFLPMGDQKKLLDKFYDSLKPSGLLFLGHNEQILDPNRWEEVEKKGIRAYKKIKTVSKEN